MRKLMIAAAGLAAVLIPVASASAQPGYGRGGYGYNQNLGGAVFPSSPPYVARQELKTLASFATISTRQSASVSS